MRYLTGCGAVAMFAAAVSAQQPAAFAIEAIPGAQAVAVGILWDHRSRDLGPSAAAAGEAAILANCRLDHARSRVPRVVASLHVDAEVTCIVGVVPVTEALAAAEFAAALLDDGRTMADDTIALATARAALAADDLQYLIPAGVLAARARAALGSWQQPVGDSRAMLQSTPAQVRSWLRQPGGVVGAVRGAVASPLREALGRIALTACPPAEPRQRGAATPSGGLHEEVHSRVDQPFVMAAFAVPGQDALPAFVLACEVARERAARRFQLRGSELRARTPFVAWSPLAGEDIACFHRRGVQFVQLLPGEVAADANAELAATAAELAGFLQELRQAAPTAAEVAKARTHALAELGLEPATVANSAPAVLGGRLRAAMLAKHRGLDAAAIAAVGVAEVQQVLAQALDPAGAYWHALMPAPQPDRGWRRR